LKLPPAALASLVLFVIPCALQAQAASGPAPQPVTQPAAQPTSRPAQKPAPRPSVGERVVAAAESHLGAPYVFGGRDARRGCRRHGKRVRCQPGIDCQSLIFFAYEKVCGRPWTAFSVMPSISVKRRELGDPVPGLDGVLREELDAAKLQPGDVLFFLLTDYNLDVDPPLLERDGKRYGVWHTGLFHGTAGEAHNVIHAKPGEKVVIEPIENIGFDALYVMRAPSPRRCPRSRR